MHPEIEKIVEDMLPELANDLDDHKYEERLARLKGFADRLAAVDTRPVMPKALKYAIYDAMAPSELYSEMRDWIRANVKESP